MLGVCGAHRFYVGEIGWGEAILLHLLWDWSIYRPLHNPRMIRRWNLVDRALSEDLKNDAIRNATMVISGISAAIMSR